MTKLKPMKIRARMKGKMAEIKVLIFHPMDTGLRKDKETGKAIPAHFIKEVSVTYNGNNVMNINMGIAVSKNPFLSFRIKNAVEGNTVGLKWTDNIGESDSRETKIR